MGSALIAKAWGLGLLRRQEVERLSPRRRRRYFYWALFLGSCFVVLALFHVWVRLQVIHLGYVLSTTNKWHNQLEHENRELKVEWATLVSPDRLERMARNRLGLRPPDEDQVVILP